MSAATTLIRLGFIDEVANARLLGLRVQVAHGTLRYHRFKLTVEGAFETADEVHLEAVGVFDDFGVN